jgi:hypothetical protein
MINNYKLTKNNIKIIKVLNLLINNKLKLICYLSNKFLIKPKIIQDIIKDRIWYSLSFNDKYKEYIENKYIKIIKHLNKCD